MKRLICTALISLMLAVSFAGCGEKKSDAASKVDSAVSGAMSNAGEAVDDIGEGVTAAVSAAASEAERMRENGEVSDGDGVIGNEDSNAADDEIADATGSEESLL